MNHNLRALERATEIFIRAINNLKFVENLRGSDAMSDDHVRETSYSDVLFCALTF